MGEYDEWNQNDEYHSVPILSLSCEKTAIKIINRSEDGVRRVASSGESSEFDVHQNHQVKPKRGPHEGGPQRIVFRHLKRFKNKRFFS